MPLEYALSDNKGQNLSQKKQKKQRHCLVLDDANIRINIHSWKNQSDPIMKELDVNATDHS